MPYVRSRVVGGYGISGVAEEWHAEDNEKFYFGDDDDVALYWDGSKFCLTPATGETMKIEFTSGRTTIYGGDSTGDDLELYANTADSYPYLLFNGNSTVGLFLPTGYQFKIKEQTTDFMVFDRSGSTYTTDATSGVGWTEVGTSVNTGVVHEIRAWGLTSGSGLKIEVDSDNLSTGRALRIRGGAAADQNWLEVIKNANSTESCQVILDGSQNYGNQATPTLAFGDGDSGFYEESDDKMLLALGGAHRIEFSPGFMRQTQAAGWRLQHETASSTNPVFVFFDDEDTGLGSAAADQLSLICGGTEAIRITRGTGVTNVYGSSPTGDDLKIFANSTDDYPYFIMYGNGGAEIRIKENQTFEIREEGSPIFSLSKSTSQFSSDNTWGAAFIFDANTVTLGEAVRLDMKGLTGGFGLHIRADSDNLTTGKVFVIRGGAASDQNWVEVIKNANSTESCQLILDGSGNFGNAATPTLAFGDGDTGFYEGSDDDLRIATAGVRRAVISNAGLCDINSGCARIRWAASSATQPGFDFYGDPDTGIGRADADQLSLIAGGSEIQRLTTTGITMNKDVSFADNLGVVFGSGSDVKQYWDGTNLVFNPATGETMTISFASGTTTIYGGDSNNDYFYLYPNPTNTDTYIKMYGSYWIEFGGAELKLNDSTGNYASWKRSGTILTASTVTSGNVFKLSCTSVTSGRGLYIEVDSDNLETGATEGKAMEILGGASSDQSWLKVIKNANSTESCQLILDGSQNFGHASTPTLAFGDGDSGFFETADDELKVAIAGVESFIFTGTVFGYRNTDGPVLRKVVTSATEPGFAKYGDTNTGIGFAAADQLSLIAGGKEIARCYEDTAGWFETFGGRIIDRTSTAADLTTDKGMHYIGVTDTTAARTITLASATVEEGRVVIIKDESGGAGTNNITIATEGAETIDGANTYTIGNNYGAVTLISDGTNWFAINSY